MNSFCFFWTIIASSVFVYSVIADPQTRLLNKGASQYNATNPFVFMTHLNQTLSDLRAQLSNGSSTRFATAQSTRRSDPVYGMVQCRNYLSRLDCLACYDAAEAEIRKYKSGNGARVILDGCFLRYSTTSFFPSNRTTDLSSLLDAEDNIGRKVGIAKGKTERKVAIGVGTGVVGILLTCILFILYQRRKRNKLNSSSALISRSFSVDPQRKVAIEDNIGRKMGIGLGTGIAGILLTLTKRNKTAQKAVEDFLKNYGSLAPKRYNYHEITKITNSFKIKLGQGGYGVVYKGKLVDGRLAAVKLLNKAKADGEEFMNEVASISRTSHVNIVQLLGFCFDGSKRALIYEFMANGSLEKFIYDHPSEARSRLEWKTLHEIVIGVARGLEYLHRGCNTRILHFDIKPHNILLDQDFTPKISDFGLAKLCPRNQSTISMLDARGTAGYIAPEVFSRNFGRVSHKSDVYSYGMMVFEIVGKRKNIDVRVDHTSEIYFPHWIYKRLQLDEDLGLDGIMSEEEEEMTKKMLLVALWCIQTIPTDRPTISRVVEMLEGSQESLSIPPMPNLCSPSRDPVGS